MRTSIWPARLCFWLLPALMFLAIMNCSREPDSQLVMKVDGALQAGSLGGRREAIEALSELLDRHHAKATEAPVVDCLLGTGAAFLTDDAQWTDRDEARVIYDFIRRYEDSVVVEGLVRKVIGDQINRLHVLFLGVKLGIPGSEERLNRVLEDYGDKNMAEDFLNSGSQTLHEGARQWGDRHGYYISTGMGSHRVSWGSF